MPPLTILLDTLYKEQLLHLINLDDNNVKKYSISNNLFYKSDDDII